MSTRRNVVFVGVLAAAILLTVQGYCDNSETVKAIDDTTKKVSDLLFSPTIRKVALTIGGGAGLFQAFMAGSIRPLLIWGGLGLAVCYLPVFVNWIGNL